MRRPLVLGTLLVCTCAPVSAQTVLYDGLSLPQGSARALLAPAEITGNSYATFARLEFAPVNRVNLFGMVGGRFNGGAAGLAGAGWNATFVRQSNPFPLNFGFFNSFVFPLQSGGPDALVTLAPVFSHSFERSKGGYVIPYGGVSATTFIGAPGTAVNALLGVRITQIASRWDFVTEVQPGEATQFSVGFFFRF